MHDGKSGCECSWSCDLGHLTDEGDSVELSLTDIRLRLVFNLSKYSSLLCTRLDSKPRQRADSSLNLALVLALQVKMILLVENMFPSCFESPHRNNFNIIHAVLNVLGHLIAYESQLNINPSLVLDQPRKARPFITPVRVLEMNR